MVSKKQVKELLKREVEEISVKQTAENLDEILTDDWVARASDYFAPEEYDKIVKG